MRRQGLLAFAQPSRRDGARPAFDKTRTDVVASPRSGDSRRSGEKPALTLLVCVARNRVALLVCVSRKRVALLVCVTRKRVAVLDGVAFFLSAFRMPMHLPPV